MTRAPTTPASGASDIPRGGWIDRYAPAPARPYLRLARLDRPIGTWLLLFPCWWSVVLASPGLADGGRLLLYAALFAIGATTMRGAGCTINDIVDRDIDARVARTADRPIPSGAVSVTQAAAFLGLELAIGLAVLVNFNRFAILVAIASLALVAAYPFMKRVTYWPQAWLGLTFNWGALVGFAAVTGALAPQAFLLYAAGFFWTLGYDTIYAHQDKADDVTAGVKSLALKLGEKTRPWLFAFYGATIALMAGAGYAAGLHWAFYPALVPAAAHLFWQAATVGLDDPPDCLAKFRANRYFGWLVLGALIVGQVAGGFAQGTGPGP